MNKEVKDFAVQKTKELMEAGSCSSRGQGGCPGLAGRPGYTEHEAQETEKYIKELEGDIMPIDLLIALCGVRGRRARSSARRRLPRLRPTAGRSRRRVPRYCDCPALRGGGGDSGEEGGAAEIDAKAVWPLRGL